MTPFLTQLFRNLATIRVNLDGYMIDHIAYRASTIEDADALKRQWGEEYSLHISAQVNGREVCVFSCEPPLQYEDWSIPGLELLYPKPSKPYGGWDHIEVVVGPYTDSLDVLKERMAVSFPHLVLASTERYSYDEDGSHVMGQRANPSFTIRFPDKTAVRFHTADIREIV